MANKNNSPEQKAQWERNKTIGSRFVRVIPSTKWEHYRAYPPKKEYAANGLRLK